ncbi:MAG: peptidoglycan editing factor PgeF [Burkholderiales bacterium]|nr:peptidoglycan editing factor PgeF [Burkholderiales bacterium]
MNFIVPDWPAPSNVRCLITTRTGGVSHPPYSSLNLGSHVGDDPLHVAQNRRAIRNFLPDEPKWLNQIHGNRIVNLDEPETSDADGAFTRQPNVVCAIMTADCLPVLLSGRNTVAALHAGWRGLAAGIIEKTVPVMGENALVAYLGPAIGQEAFEVGEEVLDALEAESAAFRKGANGKWHADLYAVARMKLEKAGISGVHGGNYCTYRDASRFFSHRRDGKTGRMGSFIWLDHRL